MSRHGNCYDNAPAESFWSRLKTELLDGGSFPGLVEARLEVNHYIAYYNAERRHSALAYQSPNRFETQLQTTSQFCPAYLDLFSLPLFRDGFLKVVAYAFSWSMARIVCKSTFAPLLMSPGLVNSWYE